MKDGPTQNPRRPASRLKVPLHHTTPHHTTHEHGALVDLVAAIVVACDFADILTARSLALLLSMILAAVVVHGGAVRVLAVAGVVGYVVVGAMPIYVMRVVLIPDGMWCGGGRLLAWCGGAAMGCQNWQKRGEKALICKDNLCGMRKKSLIFYCHKYLYINKL